MKIIDCFVSALDVITHAFYPNSCLICQKVCCSDAPGLCSDCLSKLEPAGLGDWKNRVTHNAYIDHAYSGWYFNVVFKNVIHSFKYLGRPKFALYFGRCLAKEVNKYSSFSTVDMLIPVPLHPVKKRNRGFNQADWIARGLAEELKIPSNNRIIKRIRYTPSQTTLNMEERVENVASAFNCMRSLNDLHVCIIDDVLTTGSTISAVAKACKMAGAKQVTALTLCTPKTKRVKL